MKIRIFAPADAAFAALFLLFLVVIAAPGLLMDDRGSGFTVQSPRQGRGRPLREVSLSAVDLQVNPNQAGAARLASLPGIGPTLAEAVVRFRELHGPFQRLSDLEAVPGIGPKRLERILPYLTLGDEAAWSTR